jgi:RNA polymerase sigma factor (sigma-70 family)
MIQQSPTIPPTDAELLMRFCGGGDDVAFRLLVERHAGLVMTICRRVLVNRQDVEDAFQATFLVLARRADSIRSRDCIGSWLFKVAHRTAIRAARETHNRGEIQLTDEIVIPSPTLAHLQERETFELLAAELNRLPENYRAALILFYLEGKSRQATADELDVSEAALKARLARGRQLLRRLMRRGVSLSLAMAAVTATSEAALTAGLVEKTIAAGLSYAATGTVSAACSAHTVSLAKGFSPMLSTTLTKPILTAAVLLTAGLLVAVGVGTHSSFADGKASGGKKSQPQEIQTTVESDRSNQSTDAFLGFAEVGEEVPVEGENRANNFTPKQRIQAALKEFTRFQLVDMPLNASLELIAKQHNFNILVDEISLSRKDVSPEVRINYKSPDSSVRKMLETILAPLNLTYVVEDGAVKVIAATAAGKGIGEAEPRPDVAKRITERERIQAALVENSDVKLEFIDTPLREAFAIMQKQYGVNLWLDGIGLSRKGIDLDEPITMVLSGVSLRGVLKIILEPLELTYVVEDEIINITGAPPNGPLDVSERSEAAAKIEEALTETTEIEFVDTSLKDAMDFIADLHNITIILNETALSEEGIGTDEPITQVLSGISLGSTLNIILKPLGLTYLIEDEVMKITTVVAAAKRKEIRVYSVTTLVAAGYEMDALQQIVEQQGGGDVNVLGDTLVVTQPQQKHRKTMQLLEQLQRAVDLQKQ